MDSINIRSIQHFLYCSHRWGLIEIDRAWAENYFVVKANLLHERVHDPDRHYAAKDKRVFTSVPVWNDLPEYNIYGIVDCLEAAPSAKGISLDSTTDKYQLCLVEYKPKKPKDESFHETDALQVFAQKICVDFIFGGSCSAVLYYADVKKRVELPFEACFSIYEAKLKETLRLMRENLQLGNIPPIKNGQKCSGCSMQVLCMPKMKKQKRIQLQITEALEDDL